MPLLVLPSLHGKRVPLQLTPQPFHPVCSAVSCELTHPAFLSTDGKLSINFHVVGIFSRAVVDSCKLLLSISFSHA